MNKIRVLVLLLLSMALTATGNTRADESVDERQTIKALYLPLADHYAGVIAYEKYRDQMKHADYRIERMKSWSLLRARFMSGEVDVAFIICPMAMDMFRKRPDFRWVSLMHRDGNALAINYLLNDDVELPEERSKRLPDNKVADALAKGKLEGGKPTQCGVPHLLSTHTVVLYKYLKDYGKTLGLDGGTNKDVIAIEVPPSKSLGFIKKKNSRATPASFEQSLPWADVVETQGFGKVAWYSKDVVEWKPYGHVECIVIATDACILEKRRALREVIHYIHQAGLDIELSRLEGGLEIIDVAENVRKHIPEHNTKAIIQSLRPDLNVINYLNLNIDKAGLKQIMDLAVECGILKEAIDIEKFADTSFLTDITVQNPDTLNSILGYSKTITVITGMKLQRAVFGDR